MSIACERERVGVRVCGCACGRVEHAPRRKTTVTTSSAWTSLSYLMSRGKAGQQQASQSQGRRHTNREWVTDLWRKTEAVDAARKKGPCYNCLTRQIGGSANRVDLMA